RQLEKAVLARLKASAARDLPHIKEVEADFLDNLRGLGGVARITDLTSRVTSSNERLDQARVSFLAQLCPRIAVIEDNDYFHQAAGVATLHDDKTMAKQVEKIVEAIKKIGEPTTIEAVAESVGDKDVKHIRALASISKQIATLNKRW